MTYWIICVTESSPNSYVREECNEVKCREFLGSMKPNTHRICACSSQRCSEQWLIVLTINLDNLGPSPLLSRLASNAFPDFGSVGRIKKKNQKKSRNRRPWYPKITLKVDIYIFGLTKCTIYCKKCSCFCSCFALCCYYAQFSD